MTPIKDVFMLSIDSKLDFALLKKICETGHSRVPVYEEIEVPLSVLADPNEAYALMLGSGGMLSSSKEGKDKDKKQGGTLKVKKIIGILLVKQCVLLDPKGAALSCECPSLGPVRGGCMLTGFFLFCFGLECRSDPAEAHQAEQGAVRAQQRASPRHIGQVPGGPQPYGHRQPVQRREGAFLSPLISPFLPPVLSQR